MTVAPFQLFPGSIGAGPYTVTFELPGTYSAVRVKVLPVGATAFITQVADADYTFVRATKTVTFLAGSIPITGDVVRLERFTTRDRQVDYVSGESMSERNLDNDALRLTMIDQEIESDLSDALKRNDARTAWDAEGLPSENALPAVALTGWTTLGQVNALLANVQVADLNTPTVQTITGDGTTAEYLLTGAIGLATGQPLIWINGVIQRSDSGDYEILNVADSGYPSWASINDVLSFDTAPPNGAIIHIKFHTGTVLGVLPDEFVNDSDQVADDVITEDHINVSAGSAGRIMVFDATGAPTLPVASLDHLIASGQTLPNAALLAMVAAGTGLSLSLFGRAPTGDIVCGSQKLTDVATPVASTDGANKAYVDGNTIQAAYGAVPTDDIPTVFGEHCIVTPGFAADVLLVMGLRTLASNTEDNNWSQILWIRGGTDSKKMWGANFFTADAGLRTASVHTAFTISTVGATMKLINSYNDAGAGSGTSDLTELNWFALKV